MNKKIMSFFVKSFFSNLQLFSITFLTHLISQKGEVFLRYTIETPFVLKYP